MSEHRLSEIVIERPRSGMRISLKKLKGFKKQLHQITGEASEDGLLSPYLIKPRQKSKYLSDHLGPLRRYLRSHVGQPWDTVYSQLCRQLGTNTMAGQHVLSHVWDYVERHVELLEGIPYRKTARWRGDKRLDQDYRDQFYVHPETGMLCEAKKISRRSKPIPSETNVVFLDHKHQYHKLHGIWYLITFEPLPLTSMEPVIDILQGVVSYSNARLINGQRMYATQKRQCNKKTIRFIQSQLPQS